MRQMKSHIRNQRECSPISVGIQSSRVHFSVQHPKPSFNIILCEGYKTSAIHCNRQRSLAILSDP